MGFGRKPICSVSACDFGAQMSGTDPIYVKDVIQRERDCDKYNRWDLVSTPKEYLEMLAQEQLRKQAEERLDKDRQLQEQRLEKDRLFQQEMRENERRRQEEQKREEREFQQKLRE